jgi:cyclic beta-1,2-glucan synthetase
MEWVLGLQVRGEKLVFAPCIPKVWRSYSMVYQLEQTRYEIAVENPNAVTRGIAFIELDGERQTGESVPLVNDEQVHQVRVVLG